MFFLARPLGWIFELIFNILPDSWPKYGIAVIIFTIIIKLCILPLNIKQQKSMLKQQKLQPQLSELQRKYANDKEKLNREMMELYKANGASPTAGCLPLLIQLPIIMGLYRVIQRPLTYITRISEFHTINSDTRAAAVEKVSELVSVAQQNGISVSNKIVGADGSLLDAIKNGVENYQIAISHLATQVSDKVADCADWIRDAAINFNFLGINLASYPSEAGMPLLNVLFSDGSRLSELKTTWPLLIVPVLSGLSSWFISYMTQAKQKRNQTSSSSEVDQAQAMSKSMTYMMPLMSFFITFSLPSAIGIYWIISNLFQIVQQYITQVIFHKKEDEIVVIDTVKKNRKDSKKRR